MCCTVSGQGAGPLPRSPSGRPAFVELDVGQVQAELERQHVRIH